MSQVLEFRPMNDVEYAEFIDATKVAYASDVQKANFVSEEEAKKRAAADFERALPNGLETEGAFLFLIEASGEKIGHVWYQLRPGARGTKAFLYDIRLDPAHRGQGFGRKAMRFLADHAKAQGANRLGLHVFGFNHAAIKLYESEGFEVTDLVMEKDLG